MPTTGDQESTCSSQACSPRRWMIRRWPAPVTSRPAGARTSTRSTSPRRRRCARSWRRSRRRPDGGGAGRPVLAVTATTREAEDLAAGAGRPASRPSRSPSTRPGRRCRTSGSRPAATPSGGGWPCCAGWPTRGEPGPLRVVVAPVRSVLQPQLKGLGDLEPIELRTGADAPISTHVVRRLADIAYARTDLVTKRGEFAVRGGILDVFPPTEEHPLRVEFWGDEIEEIRTFAVADQRTIEKVDRLWAPPCRELLLTDDVRERARAIWPSGIPSWPRCSTSSPTASRSRAWSRWPPRCSTARDSLELVLHCMPRGQRRAAVRPGADPDPGARPGPHQRGVPAGELGRGRGRRARPRSTSARPRSSRWPTCGRRRRQLGQPWWSVSPFGVAEPAATVR